MRTKIKVANPLSLIVIMIITCLIFNHYCGIRENKKTIKLYQNLTAMHFRQDQNLPVGLVYFIGDSHVQGLATQAITMNSVNYGIGSDTTDGVANRLHLYHSLKSAKAIYLAIGFNDLKLSGPQEIIENLSSIVASLPSDIPIFLNDIFPINDNSTLDLKINKNISKLNELIYELCKSNSKLECVYTHPFLKNRNSQLAYDFEIGDGIHLNKLGYENWIRIITQALKNRMII